MNLKKILSILEAAGELPIKPNALAKILKESGAIEQVVYVGVDINSDFLQGKFVRVRYDETARDFIPRPYEIPASKIVAKIYYDRSLPEERRRLVVNKELLHIIDPDLVRTATAEQAKKLVRNLQLPRELLVGTPGATDSDQASAFIDYLSETRAVIVMVPQDIRNLICEKYVANKINEDEIAKIVGVPREYVSLILAPQWDVIRDFWLKLP